MAAQRLRVLSFRETQGLTATPEHSGNSRRKAHRAQGWVGLPVNSTEAEAFSRFTKTDGLQRSIG